MVTALDRAIAARMSERELEQRVREICQLYGLAVSHFHDSRRSWLPGFPDLEIIGTAILHRELKSQQGTLSVDQRYVGSIIIKAGGDWAVWRPADLLDGTIHRQLAPISRNPRASAA